MSAGETLTVAQREILRHRLQRRAERLRSEIVAGLHSRDLREDSGERNADEALADDRIAEVERDDAELAEVRQALERLEGPDYGMCADCAGALTWERMNALPHARRCTSCEALHCARGGKDRHASL